MEEARTHDTIRVDKSVKHLLGDAERETFHVQVSRGPIAKLLHLRFEGVRRTCIRVKGRRNRSVSCARNLVDLLEKYGYQAKLIGKLDNTQTLEKDGWRLRYLRRDSMHFSADPRVSNLAKKQ